MPLTRRQTFHVTTASLLAAALPKFAFADDKFVSTIIDTHTHFYDPTRPQGVPWPGKNDSLLYKPYFPKDYRAVAVPAGVTGTVIVEASPWLEDNQWILDLAKDDPFIVGFVGNLAFNDPKYSENLKRFAAFKKFRGVRSKGNVVVKNINDPVFISALKQLADKDLSLDLLCGAEHLDAIAQLGKTIPSLRIILNHCASIRIDGKAPTENWLLPLGHCAKQSNIFCKVSGLPENTGNKDGSATGDVSFYKPVLDALWNNFGEERVVYGSNWPVCLRSADLARVQNIVMSYVTDKGPRAAKRYFSENAKHFYKYIL